MSDAAERKRFDLGGYVEVKDRIKLFYELFGQGRLTTERVEILTAPDGKQRVMAHAQAFRTPDDPHPGDGYSWLEIPGTTPYTRGSEVENAETSAWGRAIGSLGILIDASIASQNEIDAKAGESRADVTDFRPALSVVRPKEPTHEATTDGGLIGTVEVGKPPADFELREGPDGMALSFKLMDGRKGFAVVAKGAIALSLYAIKDEIVGQRVTCWGRMGTDSFDKGKQTITYNVLDLDRIVGAGFELPLDEPSQEAAGEPVQTPEAPAGEDEYAEPVPVESAGEASPGPAPADLCGSPSPYTAGDTCQAQAGHAGKHVNFEGLGTSWPAR